MTGQLFKSRLNEHKNDVENAQKEQYTRSEMKQSQSTTNKSALTDQTTTENHLVDWGGGANVVHMDSGDMDTSDQGSD